jgi:tetratricopeptide (TPR) repeat protein
MGRYEDALPLYTPALEIWLEQLGERHPDVATSFNNLAFLYQSTGRYPEAIANYQKALSIAEESLGKEHPNTVTIRNNYLQMRHIRNKLKIISQMSRITSEFFSNPSTFNL